jgi:hypothetical protein
VPGLENARPFSNLFELPFNPLNSLADLVEKDNHEAVAKGFSQKRDAGKADPGLKE